MSADEDDQIVGTMVEAVAARYPCVDPEELADDPDVDDTPIGHIWEDQREALDGLRRAGFDVVRR